MDSGLIETLNGEFVISELARSRYNALAIKYGRSPDLVTPIQPNDGVRPAPAEITGRHSRGQLYIMSVEAMANFVRVSRWHREGRRAEL